MWDLVPKLESDTADVKSLSVVEKAGTRSVSKWVKKAEKTKTPYKEWVEVTVMVPEVVEEIKTEKVTVPQTIMTRVEVKVPREVEREFIEKKVVPSTEEITVKVPITTVVRLPTPDCHWHDVTHTHPVVKGKTHTHPADHDHCGEATADECKTAVTQPEENEGI